MSPQRIRTELQTETDRIDCQLYTLLLRVEALAKLHERHQGNSHWLNSAANQLSQARAGIRQLMHNDDREATR